MFDAGKLRFGRVVGYRWTVASRAAEVGRVIAESRSRSLVNRCPGFDI